MRQRNKITESADVHLPGQTNQAQVGELPVEVWCIIFREAFFSDCDTVLSIRLTSELLKSIADLITDELFKQLPSRWPQWRSNQAATHSNSALFFRMVKHEEQRLQISNALIKKLDQPRQFDKLPLTFEDFSSIPVSSLDCRLFSHSGLSIIQEASRVVRKINFDDALVTSMDRYVFPRDLGAYLMSAVNVRAYEALAVLLAVIKEEYRNSVSLKRILGAIYYHAAAFYQDFELERLFQYIPVSYVNRRICFRYPLDYFAGSMVAVQTTRYERLLDVATRYQNQSGMDYLVTLGASESPRQAFREGRNGFLY